MNPGGGEHEIVRLSGGQGTISVTSCRDSRRFDDAAYPANP
jgi:hypothetical protein